MFFRRLRSVFAVDSCKRGSRNSHGPEEQQELPMTKTNNAFAFRLDGMLFLGIRYHGIVNPALQHPDSLNKASST